MKLTIAKLKSLVSGQQHSVLSAASLIMIMIVASRLLGLIRQRVLAHYFVSSDLSLFFAAFRLPDTVFEVLVFGTFASAFIPIFTKTLKSSKFKAWQTAGIIANWGGIFFLILASLVVIFAHPLYRVITPGFTFSDQTRIADLARVLFIAQGFFVISYVLTAVLESSKRFFVPALAPLFYNLGIIITTIIFSKQLGLFAPVIGVLIGSALHFLIQLPLAIKLGFKFSKSLKITPEVRRIAKLSIPRIIEVSFLQVAKFVELTLASLISAPAYTYFTFGNTVQLLPVGLFGTSIAKAALPTLARQADDLPAFKKTLFETLNQIVFLMTPIVAFLMVARIPIVRLIFGTDIFTWDSTVETSLVISAFAIGIFSQAANSILARAFYAMHDTKTPVKISVVILIFNIILDYLLVIIYKFPVWGLAFAFSLSAIIQSVILFVVITKRIHDGAKTLLYLPILKSLFSGFVSGGVMFFILKFFDKSVWVKKLSFIANVDLPFEKFVLDTRYAGNLLALTIIVGLIGCLIYVFILKILKSTELETFVNLFKRMLQGQKFTTEVERLD
ncbi:murein biosynthesis integral membrane protein MurJ [Candidatus Woesebacteria bacterium GWC2_33_12]|uniref:Probable lipid II flippase MurJ n=1 Tax=Candidatus Woesebacteria bacterium GW2011_GWB1_33_22 TaxID=1618566 RepID=A0A0F9ZYY3_9BACT|nr:MAG: Integral membrane protein MviN [Candidatus Woesebacteria bacterium GW2011_GWC2_33_12]KKP41734.1 MAG: Integral membrane protein MviN [Candidatus Woesebacteria bacterium GW2011_GWA2_33_20]KKP44131.1 MAG: Integral membrane protein MviN [Candidatus Woesebacteria bacterium GW2011_GWB1_33_22]KKP45790.1 MAG: Integral membrane protein MviN [Microgenomates group bacterium GW2011_GWC1_33_28]KKP50213.1 MAG: Integral membrane protein MviN [Candidatus Woesebacteria bacterium GW2011_GWA1_33_33]OGM07